MHDALSRGRQDFVLLDVRSPDAVRQGTCPARINLPHGKITGRKMAEWPAGTLFVVYCAGPHCNGANKGAIRLAELGRPVKEMIGGDHRLAGRRLRVGCRAGSAGRRVGEI